jgi:FkbH-like protein
MKAQISDFKPLYLERITQLTNKTNQFNLTTKRYPLNEIEAISKDNGYIKLYGKLQDKYGDNGLVSVIIGKIDGSCLYVELWLMSCRVVKRNMELAMFDELVNACSKKAIKKIIGSYIPTKKNGIVANHFLLLGFTKISSGRDGSSSWEYEIKGGVQKLNTFIEIQNE